MKKENKLVNKVKRLIRRAGIPRFLHHFGPKKYEFWQHLMALLIKQECRLGYRRVSWLLASLGLEVPTYSALAKMNQRMPLTMWQLLLRITASQKLNLVAIDGTGMSRPLPSPYYTYRTDRPYPIDIPLKLSIAICTRTKKVLSLRLRAKRSHDIKDAKYLIKHLPGKPKTIIADKGYDAEWLHQYCHKLKIRPCIPIKNNGRIRHNRWTLRRTNAKKFKKKTYNRREMVETTFSVLKRKFGSSVSSIRISAQRAEMYCRAIAYNTFSIFTGLFQRGQALTIVL